MSSLLAMPLVALTIEVGNNEDWIDSIVYCVPPPTDPTAPQLDLRGIDFEMELRKHAEDHEVSLSASTKAGTIQIGLPPNFGYLIFYVPYKDTMQYMAPGDYVGDIVGNDGQYQRRVANIFLTIDEGITR
jgi:hypothetical protein